MAVAIHVAIGVGAESGQEIERVFESVAKEDRESETKSPMTIPWPTNLLLTIV